MSTVRLRAMRAQDVEALTDLPAEEDPFGFFGFRPVDGLRERYAQNGLISENDGTLAVVDPHDTEFYGTVGWHALQHGPSSTARAMNVGIHLLAQHRGKGIGTAAQATFVQYLFDNTLIERLEASTDVENIAEQRALTKAGFQREGVLRHAQFRAGLWRDLVLFSRLRGDPAP